MDLLCPGSAPRGEVAAGRFGGGQLKAGMPVIARPMISACTSWVPS